MSDGRDGTTPSSAKKTRKKLPEEHLRTSSYAGKVPELKGYVYDVGYKGRDQFARTTKEIAEYIARTYKGAGEFVNALDPSNLGFPTIVFPPDPDPLANRIVMKKWETHYREAAEKERIRNVVSEQAYSVILGQCSPAVRDRIEAQHNYTTIQQDLDIIELLKLIRNSLYAGATSKKHEQSAQEALERLVLFKQGHRMTNATYLEKFKELTEIMEHFGYNLGATEETLVNIVQQSAVDPLNPTEAELQDAKKVAKERFYAVMFLRHADRRRYGNMMADLENSHTRGTDEYPKTMTSAYDYLVNYRAHKHTNPSTTSDGVAYFSNERQVREEGQNTQSNRTPRKKRWHKKPAKNKPDGHQAAMIDAQVANEVAEADNQSDSDSKLDDESIPYDYHCTNAVIFYQSGSLSSGSLIIDSASSVNIISNEDMLDNIRMLDETHWLPIITVGSEVVHLKHKGDFGDYPEPVWYYPQGKANIMSLCNVKKHFRVTMDTKKDDAFYLHNDQRIVRFGSAMKGIYVLDEEHNIPAQSIWSAQERNNENQVMALYDTVDDRRQQYTKRSYRQAQKARQLQNIIMRPSLKDMEEIVIDHLKDCPVTKQDLRTAEHIFGANVGALKGKTTRETPSHVPTNINPVPDHILKLYRNVTLCVDIMFVNKIPFLITLSRNIKFVTVEALADRHSNSIKKALSAVVNIYQHRGLRVATIMADNEFEHMRSTFPMLNTCAANEHVPDIERCIRTVKERTRCTYNTLPYQYIPRVMLIHMIRNTVLWMNAFPSRNGVSTLHSPRYIVIGNELSYNLHAQTEFGRYVQTHEQHDNTMAPRTMGAICLGPTGNMQGSHWFMSLTSGAKVKRHRWTELPTPTDAIQRVNQIGRNDGMPSTISYSHRSGMEISDPLEEFFDRDNNTSTGLEHDNDRYFMPETYDPDDPQVIYDHPTIHLEDDVQDDIIVGQPIEQEVPDENNTIDLTGVDDPDDGENQGGHLPNEGDHDDTENEEEGVEVTLTEHEQFQVAEDDGRQRAQTNQVGARTRQTTRNDPDSVLATLGLKLNHNNTTIQEVYSAIAPHANDLLCFLTEQMSAKKGLRMFGEEGAKALTKELEQLVDRKVMHPVDGKKLSREQKRAALRYLMFLKEKRSGEIKGRGCADGRKQRVYKSKEETHSPTVSTEAMFITAMFDAMEARDVAIVDIPGAFMQVDIDELINIKLEGELVDLIVRIEPSYSKYIQVENGRRVIYAELDKALYGTMQAALLFWKRVTTFLVDTLGFTINPYDACVANKDVDGSQFTICWHVDDFKLSHRSAKVVSEIIQRLQDEFGKESPLTVQRGKVFDDYLGMRMDFSKKGKVIFSMQEYIDRLVNETPDELLKGPCGTPAANHLFQVNDNAPLLDEHASKIYHHLTATILYLAKKTRPDIQVAVSFLSTRVKEPSIDDWKKLGRCIRYLSATRDLVLTLEADNDGIIQWWVDASYAVHPNMRSHTGATVSLGKGSPFSMSSKQKINTRSSTEAELVGVNDAMALILWTRLFIEAQGYSVTDNIVHQDNQSAILLENNGKRSSSKKTRHIEIRYFFITDNIRRKQMRVAYCPTEDMRADFMTKPLQGAAFRKFRMLTLNTRQ